MKKTLLILSLMALLVPSSFAQMQWYSSSVTGATFPLPVQMGGTVIYDGYLYAPNGYGVNADEANYAGVYFTELGPNNEITSWVQAATMPQQQAYTTDMVCAYNGWIYVPFGWNHGAGPAAFCRHIYAGQITGSTGSVDSWVSVYEDTGNQYAVDCAAAFIANGYLYVVCGDGDVAPTDKILYWELQPDGSLGTIQETTAPKAVLFHGGEVVDDHIVIFGGLNSWTNTDINNDVMIGELSASDGSISNWSTLSNHWPEATYGMAATVIGNTLYTYSGRYAGAVMCATMQQAVFSGGTLGSFADVAAPRGAQIPGVPDGMRYGNLASLPTGEMYTVGARFGGTGAPVEAIVNTFYQIGPTPTPTNTPIVAGATSWSEYR